MQSMKNKAIMQKDVNGKIIILLENEGHVKDCISWLDEISGEKLIIALTPFAMHELDTYGLNYRIPEDYYDAEELYQMGIDNFKKVEDLSKLIDSSIQQSDHEIAEYNVKPAMFNFYHVKIAYDSVTIRIFQLLKIISKEKPDLIYAYETNKYPFGAYASAPYLRFDNRESIYTQIFSLADWKVSVILLPFVQQHESESTESNRNFSNHIKQSVVPWLENHPKIYEVALTIKKEGWRGLINMFKDQLQGAEKTSALLYGSGYNWDDCHKELRKECIAPIYRIPDNFQWINRSNELDIDGLQLVWSNLQENDDFKNYFIYDGIDFFSLLKDRFEFLVEQLTIACMLTIWETMALISDKNIKAVIASTFSTCGGYSMAQAAHNCGIPVVTWQHGAYGAMHHPIINYCDLISSDAHFVFGNGVLEQYAKPAQYYNTKLVPIGSSTLVKLKNKNSDNKLISQNMEKKVILYISTAMRRNANYISEAFLFSDSHLWNVQKKIIALLGLHENYDVIVKLHPAVDYNTPIQTYATECNIKNCTFVSNEFTVPELLSKSDIVIIDLPSTTLLQATTTKNPIFVYMGYLQFDDDAKKLLKQRAFCSDDIDVFIKEINEYLSTGKIDGFINLDNQEFLQQYGITSFEGDINERAAKILKTIIHENSTNNG